MLIDLLTTSLTYSQAKADMKKHILAQHTEGEGGKKARSRKGMPTLISSQPCICPACSLTYPTLEDLDIHVCKKDD